MAKMFEQLGLKVERPPANSNLIQYIPADVYVLPKLEIKPEKDYMGKKKGGKKC